MPWLLLRVVAQKAGPGLLSRSRNVWSSTTSAASKKSGRSARCTIAAALSRSSSKVKATSRAVKGLPSAHSMPRRRRSVSSVQASLYSQLSASQFSCSPVSTLYMIRGSKTVGRVPM